MLGKGSVNHNSRQFKANNIDSDRTQFNVSYCNTPIKEIYHELFDEALRRHNKKQTRAERRIADYYEKIRTGKQEKLFYEVIFQVGNLENMASQSEDGQLAARVLDEFVKDFQERNPYLKVFSAHLHMDEATPHLHVDFVPFTTGSKRGLDTRVSLKQALANQGFVGGARGDTEWSQWVKSEKEQLSQVMERHGIQWEQLGTHDEHLSVMDFKKVQRVKEVAALNDAISGKQIAIEHLGQEVVVKQGALKKVESKLSTAKAKRKFVAKNARHYDDDPAFQLPEPKHLMSAMVYHDKIVAPLVDKLKDAIRGILLHFFDKTRELQAALDEAARTADGLSSRLKKLAPEMERLQSIEKDYKRLRRGVGEDKANAVIAEAQVRELREKTHTSARDAMMQSKM